MSIANHLDEQQRVAPDAADPNPVLHLVCVDPDGNFEVKQMRAMEVADRLQEILDEGDDAENYAVAVFAGQRVFWSAGDDKHLLLPVWMLAYRYHDKPYRVFVNAGTGEVQGERPYSWVKILFAVLAGVLAGAIVIAVASSR